MNITPGHRAPHPRPSRTRHPGQGPTRMTPLNSPTPSRRSHRAGGRRRRHHFAAQATVPEADLLGKSPAHSDARRRTGSPSALLTGRQSSSAQTAGPASGDYQLSPCGPGPQSGFLQRTSRTSPFGKRHGRRGSGFAREARVHRPRRRFLPAVRPTPSPCWPAGRAGDRGGCRTAGGRARLAATSDPRRSPNPRRTRPGHCPANAYAWTPRWARVAYRRSPRTSTPRSPAHPAG